MQQPQVFRLNKLVVNLSTEMQRGFQNGGLLRKFIHRFFFLSFFFTYRGDQNGHSLEHCAHKSQIKDLFTPALAFKR